MMKQQRRQRVQQPVQEQEPAGFAVKVKTQTQSPQPGIPLELLQLVQQPKYARSVQQ
jgi:hypothetical protein